MKKNILVAALFILSVFELGAVNITRLEIDDRSFYVINDSCQVKDAEGYYLSDDGKILIDTKHADLVARLLESDQTLSKQEKLFAQLSIIPLFPDESGMENFHKIGFVESDRVKAMCIGEQEYKGESLNDLEDVRMMIELKTSTKNLARQLRNAMK